MLKIGKLMKEAEMSAIPAMATPRSLIEFSNAVEKMVMLHRLVGKTSSVGTAILICRD
jgi:hypothetical protein